MPQRGAPPPCGGAVAAAEQAAWTSSGKSCHSATALVAVGERVRLRVGGERARGRAAEERSIARSTSRWPPCAAGSIRQRAAVGPRKHVAGPQVAVEAGAARRPGELVDPRRAPPRPRGRRPLRAPRGGACAQTMLRVEGGPVRRRGAGSSSARSRRPPAGAPGGGAPNAVLPPRAARPARARAPPPRRVEPPPRSTPSARNRELVVRRPAPRAPRARPRRAIEPRRLRGELPRRRVGPRLDERDARRPSSWTAQPR